MEGMVGEVKKFIAAVKTYCRPLGGPDYQKLERSLKSAAIKFDADEVSSKTDILRALSSYEEYLREKFKGSFQRAEATIPYKTSIANIRGESSASPENAAKAREGSASSKRSSSGQGTKEQKLPPDKKKVLDNVNKGGKGNGTTTPIPQDTKSDKKRVLDKVNKGGKGDGTATPTQKVSGIKDEEKEEVKSPSRESTTSESENWRKKFEVKEEEMYSLKKQVKMLAQELGFEWETAEEILTEATRQLKSVREQKNKDQAKGNMKELEISLESVKKAVFKVPKLKDKDHDLEKTKARVQELHRQEEELIELKKAVFNPKNRKDIKDQTYSKESTLGRIHDLQRKVEEVEISLESVRKAVFKVKKVEDKDHDLENTKARIEDLHRQGEELFALKEAVLNPNKRKVMKDLTDSKDATMFRICELQRDQNDLQDLLKTVSDTEDSPSINAAIERVQKLKRNQNDLQDLLKTVSDTDDSPSIKEAIERVEKLKRSVNDQNNDLKQQKENQKRLEMEISDKKQEISDMKRRYDSMMKSRDDMEQRLNNELKRVQSDKNNALTRLSEVAGAKLTNENPHITDLSDPNRPIKIGEQYSELYDNTWTDVFEKLTEHKMSDKEAIHMLLQILENSYSFCKTLASKRYKNILAELTLLRLAVPDEKHPKKENAPKRETTKQGKEETVQSMSHEEITVMQKFFDSHTQSVEIKTLRSVLEKIGLNETDLKYVKNLLKMTVEGTCHFVEQDIWKNRFDIQKLDDAHLMIAQPYLKKCVRICWLMVAQDPPVCLKASDKKDMKFNKDFYREFTSSGKKIDYVVWPALLLHEGGPLLKKGVAQPKT